MFYLLNKCQNMINNCIIPTKMCIKSTCLNFTLKKFELGAFLMLLRVKEESPEELAGFIEAVRGRCGAPASLEVDLDWSTYAGKKRQLPWFILAALLLSANGIRVFMHGARGHTPERIYTEDCLSLFGIKACVNWNEVTQSLDSTQFAFMSIEALSPRMRRIIK